MPRDPKIKKVLIIGSGPIVIGQSCEFDYSGSQACKVLRAEGIEVVLINSNPATIMTDPEMADRTYVEPITPEIIEKIIEKEKPDSLLPTLGGQTGLNMAVALAERGVLKKHKVRMLGANLESINKAEKRDLFKKIIQDIGLLVPQSGMAHSMDEAMDVIKKVGFPAIIRPSFTLGGMGGNIANNMDEYKRMAEWGLSLSPRRQILVEESVIGWKEFELEVMRDRKDNVVIVCSIENLDPMGVHTGDSITVAPAQTLTDKEYQLMRDASLKIIRAIGVETGGSNIQFAVNPKNGKLYVIEMNPRVSRSSALASKATGFPIAKIAAKLAIGYTLDEIPNDITKMTPASFEPTIDYCVVKFPRFTFEKFKKADPTLTVQMKSVGEAMAIGRTFKEALQKSIRSLEIGRFSLDNMYLENVYRDPETPDSFLMEKLKKPFWDRLWYVAEALRRGVSVKEVYETTGIDPWFLENILQIIKKELDIKAIAKDGQQLSSFELKEIKEFGFSDNYLASIFKQKEQDFRKFRKNLGLSPVYKTVDTCGAEFEAHTPYLYSTYEQECEANPTNKRKIVILGGGPNRIGQGIEFDYCCVHASFALREIGVESIMVNCNPETVSTDYDTSDKLFFEPLTFEDVMNIIDKEKPDGVIVQFGGQTPLKLSTSLKEAGVPIIGTSPESIDRAEDRKLFKEVIDKLQLLQPESGTARSYDETLEVARKLGYPLLLRPSFVLGGRAMEIVYNESSLMACFERAMAASPEHPVLIDKFLNDAAEVDVDAISDGTTVVVAGVMEHIEEAGIHSGDSACSLPPVNLKPEVVKEIKRQTVLLARELEVRGLINIQFAVKDDVIYILEVNPRASRTVPFVSKTIGVPLAKLAAKIQAGKTLKEMGFTVEKTVSHVAVKEAVFPFIKFPGVDPVLGPEMLSTGEVMGVDADFAMAYAKSQMGAGNTLPEKGCVFISVKEEDKQKAVELSMELHKMGFKLVATKGTCLELVKNNIPCEFVFKLSEGSPNIVDLINDSRIDFIINTSEDHLALKDSFSIRRSALDRGIPYVTTKRAATAVVKAIMRMRKSPMDVKPLQDFYKK